MRRRATLASLVTVAVTLLGIVAALLVSSTPAYASSTQKVYLTFYGWYDNTPPGCAIAYPDLHQCAGGTGSYSDPITFASDTAEIAAGTKIYVPRLEKYFIMEDDCTECDQDWSGQGPDGGPGMWHFDLWAGGQNGNESALLDCEDALTQDGSENVIISPPSTETVSSPPLFNSSTGACYGGAQATDTVGQYKNTSTGTCLTDPGGSSTSGTAADVSTCGSSSIQQFTYDGAFLKIGSLCVDNPSGSTLALDTCSGGPTEEWSVNPNGTIEDMQTSTKCVRASGSTVTAGSCSGTAAEWTFTGTTVTPSASPSSSPSPTPTSTASGGKTYEADKATLGGSADVTSCSACLDGEKVSSIGGGSSGTLTFTGVSEPSTGTYTMTVSYLAVAEAKPAVITVDGVAQTVSFPETDASSYSVIGTYKVSVKLNAGSSNTIEFSGSGTKGAPDIDHIVI